MTFKIKLGWVGGWVGGWGILKAIYVLYTMNLQIPKVMYLCSPVSV